MLQFRTALVCSAALLFMGCAAENSNGPAVSLPANHANGDSAAPPPAADASLTRPAAEVKRAVAVLQAVGDSGVSGTVVFTVRNAATVEISGEITGLEPGEHGFHVHEFGDLSDLDKGESAGGHFNPMNMPHGSREDEKRHVGDLGNITADDSGKAKIEISDRMIQLNGEFSVIGRTLVVHAGRDKFTQPSGDAGDRVAVGVIGIARSEE
jgi:Cu-Zn family superoxide dismutase